MSKKKTLILSSLLLVLLGIFFLSELLLPEFVAGKVQSEIEARYTDKFKVTEVTIKAKPALKLLLGRADSVIIKAEDLGLGKLRAALIEVVLKDARIEFFSPGIRKTSVLDQAKNIAGTLVITEKALNRFIQQERYLPLKKPKVNLLEGALVLGGKITILNSSLQTQISGLMKPTDGDKLIFLPKDIMVAGLRIPNYLRKRILEQIAFELTINLPFGLRLNNLEISENGIRIMLKK